MRDIGLGHALSSESFNNLLQRHFNAYLGHYPCWTKFPYRPSKSDPEKYVVTGVFTVEHKLCLIYLFNLLETGSLYNPIKPQDFAALLSENCDRYRNTPRKDALVKA